MKFTLKGGIFNTWPHYGERAQRCRSALLAFALTMFISENYTIFGWDSRPIFCCDIHTVKIRPRINNSSISLLSNSPPSLILTLFFIFLPLLKCSLNLHKLWSPEKNLRLYSLKSIMNIFLSHKTEAFKVLLSPCVIIRPNTSFWRIEHHQPQHKHK